MSAIQDTSIAQAAGFGGGKSERRLAGDAEGGFNALEDHNMGARAEPAAPTLSNCRTL